MAREGRSTLKETHREVERGMKKERLNALRNQWACTRVSKHRVKRPQGRVSKAEEWGVAGWSTMRKRVPRAMEKMFGFTCLPIAGLAQVCACQSAPPNPDIRLFRALSDSHRLDLGLPPLARSLHSGPFASPLPSQSSLRSISPTLLWPARASDRVCTVPGQAKPGRWATRFRQPRSRRRWLLERRRPSSQ